MIEEKAKERWRHSRVEIEAPGDEANGCAPAAPSRRASVMSRTMTAATPRRRAIGGTVVAAHEIDRHLLTPNSSPAVPGLIT